MTACWLASLVGSVALIGCPHATVTQLSVQVARPTAQGNLQHVCADVRRSPSLVPSSVRRPLFRFTWWLRCHVVLCVACLAVGLFQKLCLGTIVCVRLVQCCVGRVVAVGPPATTRASPQPCGLVFSTHILVPLHTYPEPKALST